MYLDLNAEQARSLLLGPLWRDAIDLWRDIDAIRTLPAARRLLDAGADPEDVSRALRAAALDAVFAVLSRVDAGRETHAPDAPGWLLVGTGPGGEPTDTWVRGLHEELLTLDPSGLSGAELRR